MASGPFEVLLEDLSKLLKINDLHPDRNHSCLIKFPDGMRVQVELDKFGESLIIGIDLGESEVGRYRENLFREALRTNGQQGGGRNGIFAYSQKSQHLLLYDLLPMKDLTAEKVSSILMSLIDKATIWKDAMSRGDVPSTQRAGGSSMGMFGLRP